METPSSELFHAPRCLTLGATGLLGGITFLQFAEDRHVAVRLRQQRTGGVDFLLQPTEAFLQLADLRFDMDPIAGELITRRQIDGRRRAVAVGQQRTNAIGQVLTPTFQVTQTTTGLTLLRLVQGDHRSKARTLTHLGSPMI